jgi:hypothetical protein
MFSSSGEQNSNSPNIYTENGLLLILLSTIWDCQSSCAGQMGFGGV